MRSLVLMLCLLFAHRTAANVYYDTAARYGLDPILLQAIAKVESNGKAWVMNIDGEPMHFKSKTQLLAYHAHISERPFLVRTHRDGQWKLDWFRTDGEAEAYFLRARAVDAELRIPKKSPYRSTFRRPRLENIDVGAMQINLRWHKARAGVSLERLVEPTFNLDYAARYLASLIAEHGTWQGIARYHSTTPSRQLAYQKRVRDAYLGIRALTERNARKLASRPRATQSALAPSAIVR